MNDRSDPNSTRPPVPDGAGAASAPVSADPNDRPVQPDPATDERKAIDTSAIPTGLLADLRDRFTYHQPKPGQPATYQALRDQAFELAKSIAAVVPGGREQALALTNIEQGIMWANAGIARHGK